MFNRLFSLLIASMLFCHYTAAQTHIASRLIAQTQSNISSSPAGYLDSSTYKYSGYRSGDLKHTLKYDTTIAYYFDSSNGGANLSTKPTYLASRIYDGNNNIILQQHYSSDGVSALSLYQQDSMSYDTNNNLVYLEQKNWDTTRKSWQNSSYTAYTYNNDNSVKSHLNAGWDSQQQTWVPITIDTYTYNNAGKLLSSVSSYWQSQWIVWEIYNYSYDSYGYLGMMDHQSLNGGAIISEVKNMYVNSSSSNRLFDMELSLNASNIWDTIGQTSYTYNSNHNVVASLYKRWDGSAWHTADMHLYKYDSKFNLLSDIYQLWADSTNTFVNNIRTSHTYNSFNQALTETIEMWNGTSWGNGSANEIGYKYYYESYTAGVNNIQEPIGNISLYPSPARNIVNVDIKWATPEPYTIGIYDVQGRLWQQVGYPKTAQSQIAFPVSQLPAGNYFMKVTTAGGSTAKQFVISR